MRRFRRGFTLIEVSLFLAITGLLFLGVTIGVQNSMSRQRYNDAVQSFAEFLRNIYSEVTNVQGDPNGGMSNKAVYGKLAVFGEKNDEVLVYDVIGDVSNEESEGELLAVLNKLGARTKDKDNGQPLGIVESFVPKWGSIIQSVKKGELYKGMVLIARHPSSGTVYTFKSSQNGIIELNGFDGKFTKENINFCVDPNDGRNSRANVRIQAGANNSAGVGVFYDDGNECDK